MLDLDWNLTGSLRSVTPLRASPFFPRSVRSAAMAPLQLAAGLSFTAVAYALLEAAAFCCYGPLRPSSGG